MSHGERRAGQSPPDRRLWRNGALTTGPGEPPKRCGSNDDRSKVYFRGAKTTQVRSNRYTSPLWDGALALTVSPSRYRGRKRQARNLLSDEGTLVPTCRGAGCVRPARPTRLRPPKLAQRRKWSLAAGNRIQKWRKRVCDLPKRSSSAPRGVQDPTSRTRDLSSRRCASHRYLAFHWEISTRSRLDLGTRLYHRHIDGAEARIFHSPQRHRRIDSAFVARAAAGPGWPPMTLYARRVSCSTAVPAGDHQVPGSRANPISCGGG